LSGPDDKVLVDTNVWIAFFRGNRASEQEQLVAGVLDRLIAEDKVFTCGVVEMELFQGARTGERALLEELLSSLPFIDASREDFRQAGEISARLRERGRTIPSSDALIAAVCVRRDLVLLKKDRHFAEIEGLTRLEWR
jgi:tRNA(fMet)-specific endonuclease VapC